MCNYEKDRQISGKYCEFDSDRCLKGENGLTCSGNGECQPDYTCKCFEGWTGDACGCSESQDQCQGVDGLGKIILSYLENLKLYSGICNGHGACVCNQCKCDAFKNGYYTQEDNCKELKTSCSEHEACARCIYEFIHGNSTFMDEDCSFECASKNYHDIELENGKAKLVVSSRKRLFLG